MFHLVKRGKFGFKGRDYLAHGELTGREHAIKRCVFFRSPERKCCRIVVAHAAILIASQRRAAIAYIVASVSCPLKLFRHHRMNRQLSSVYPFFGSILSMLGDSAIDSPRLIFRRKVMPVSSQVPIHLALAHSSDIENGRFCALALARDAKIIRCHGRSILLIATRWRCCSRYLSCAPRYRCL